jgi:hypothetical protein
LREFVRGEVRRMLLLSTTVNKALPRSDGAGVPCLRLQKGPRPVGDGSSKVKGPAGEKVWILAGPSKKGFQGTVLRLQSASAERHIFSGAITMAGAPVRTAPTRRGC